jgi:NADH-quinone oxidoreductase subunit J
MTGLLVPLALGQTITFWVAAVLAILGAVGVVANRRPVYSALCLAVVMIALAAIYASLQAEFLFAVQIIVYTGAVLMLFLFVIMLVGVSTHDQLIETLKGHRAAALTAALALLVLLALATGNSITSEPVGLDAVEEAGYVQSLAQLIFQRYVIAFEATAALLITAAVAAMVLAHPRRLRPKPDQATRLRERLEAYAETGRHPGALPASGVTARHNSLATPALLPDGSIAPGSVSETVAGRVAVHSTQELTGPLAAALLAIESGAAEASVIPAEGEGESAESAAIPGEGEAAGDRPVADDPDDSGGEPDPDGEGAAE